MQSADNTSLSARRASSSFSADTEQSYEELHEDLREDPNNAKPCPGTNPTATSKSHANNIDSLKSEYETMFPTSFTALSTYRQSYEMPTTSSLLKHRGTKPSLSHLLPHNILYGAWRHHSTFGRIPLEESYDALPRNVPARKGAIDKAQSRNMASKRKSSVGQDTLNKELTHKSFSSTTPTKYPDHPLTKPPRTLMEVHNQTKSRHTEPIPAPGESLYDVSADENSDSSLDMAVIAVRLGDGRSPSGGLPSSSERWRSPSPKPSRRPAIVAGRVAPFPRESVASYRGLGKISPSFQELALDSVHRGRTLTRISCKPAIRSRSSTSVGRDDDWHNSSILPTWGLDPYPPINREDNPFKIRSRSLTGTNPKPIVDVSNLSFEAPKLRYNKTDCLESPDDDAIISHRSSSNSREISDTNHSSALTIRASTPKFRDLKLPSDDFAFLSSPYSPDAIEVDSSEPRSSSKSPSKAISALIRRTSNVSLGSVSKVLQSPRSRSRPQSGSEDMPGPSRMISVTRRDSLNSEFEYSINANLLTPTFYGLGISLPDSHVFNAGTVITETDNDTDSIPNSPLSRRSYRNRMMNRRILNKDECESSEDEAPNFLIASSLSRHSTISTSRVVLDADDTDMDGETSEDDEEDSPSPPTSPTSPTNRKFLARDSFLDVEVEELTFDEQYDFEDAFEPRPEKDFSEETETLINRLRNIPISGRVRQCPQDDERGLQDSIHDFIRHEAQFNIQTNSWGDFQEDFQGNVHGSSQKSSEDDLQDDLHGNVQEISHDIGHCYQDSFPESSLEDIQNDIQDDRLYAQQLLGFSATQMTHMMNHSGPATLDEILAVSRQPDFRERMELDIQGASTDEQSETAPEDYLDHFMRDNRPFAAVFEKFAPMFTSKGDTNESFNPAQAFMEMKNDPSNPLAAWTPERVPKVKLSEMNDIEFAWHESERAEVVVPGELDDVRRNVRAMLAEKLNFFEDYDDIDHDLSDDSAKNYDFDDTSAGAEDNDDADTDDGIDAKDTVDSGDE